MLSKYITVSSIWPPPLPIPLPQPHVPPNPNCCMLYYCHNALQESTGGLHSAEHVAFRSICQSFMPVVQQSTQFWWVSAMNHHPHSSSLASALFAKEVSFPSQCLMMSTLADRKCENMLRRVAVSLDDHVSAPVTGALWVFLYRN